jgi:hypothetical protein
VTFALDQPGLAAPDATQRLVEDLKRLAVRALVRMYRPTEGRFAFRIRRVGSESRLEGVSARYTAIALIGLAEQPVSDVEQVLARESGEDVCGRLLDEIGESCNLGDTALTLWAACRWGHTGAERALQRLIELDPLGPHPTVEVAWALTALGKAKKSKNRKVEIGLARCRDIAERVARRLIESFQKEAGLFPHELVPTCTGSRRRHVACFADLVYSIQALSLYAHLTGDEEALRVAQACADRMCALQGPDGQWWWHYDIRTGEVVERYPVYAVHQSAMAPMALWDLAEAGGNPHRAAIRKGLRWLMHAPEIGASLMDRRSDLIWRKVARREPGKLVRRLQCFASSLNPALRVPGVDLWFPPVCVDYESRPYHMGWILHAWTEDRVARLAASSAGVPQPDEDGETL